MDEISYNWTDLKERGMVKLARLEAWLKNIPCISFPRILIFGGSGLVGNSIINAAVSTGLKEFVIGTCNRKVLPGFISFKIDRQEKLSELTIKNILEMAKPQIVINAIGIPTPEKCTKYPATASFINSDFPDSLADIIVEYDPNCFMLHLSSESVLQKNNLTGDDEQFIETPPDKSDVYGFTKWIAEKRLHEKENPLTFCLRLPIIIGTYKMGAGWDTKIIEKIKAGEPFYAFTGSPRSFASIHELGYTLLLLCYELAHNKIQKEFINLPGPVLLTYFELLQGITNAFSLPPDLIKKCEGGNRRIINSHRIAVDLGISLEVTPFEAIGLGL